MNRTQPKAAPPCPACEGTGDEWHHPYHNEPAEPYECRACRGTGDQVAPATPKRGYVDAGLDILLFDLCGNPRTLVDLELSKQLGVFKAVAADIDMDPTALEAACCRVIGAEEPELPF